MRQFIDSPTHARIIVLNNKVIDSIEYIAQGKDFRTNTGTPKVQKKHFSKEIERLAIQSVNLLNLEFGGVDILLDNKQNPYLAEVNCPCFFPRCQDLTGIDISGMILDRLKEKIEAEKN